MVSTVKTRPNHYERLGISPTASSDEIVRAFAREISVLRPRAFGGAAEVSMAYETLRDPARRRAYDEAIGLAPKPAPPAQTWAFPSTYGGYAQRAPAPRLKPQPEPPHESPPTSPVVAALKQLAEPAPLAAPPSTAPPAEPSPKAEEVTAIPRQPEVDERPGQRAYEAPQIHADAPAMDWKRTGAFAGGLVAAVGVLGALAGWQAGNDIEAAQKAEPAVTVSLPRPSARTSADISDPALSPIVTKAAPARPKRSVASRGPHSDPTPQLGRALSEQEIAELPPVEVGHRPADASDAPSEQAAAETAPTEAIPASMPLPNTVVARTIGRIGYPCGSVASATALQGEAPGTFKVTCTSGHSYRAAPVRGRYHFKRLGSQ